MIDLVLAAVAVDFLLLPLGFVGVLLRLRDLFDAERVLGMFEEEVDDKERFEEKVRNEVGRKLTGYECTLYCVFMFERMKIINIDLVSID